MELDNYEATPTFTSVTTQIVAHPAIRGFVDGLQKATFPSPPAIQATGLPAFTLAGLPPANACGPSLGTLIFKSDPKVIPFAFFSFFPFNLVPLSLPPASYIQACLQALFLKIKTIRSKL